MNRQVKETWIWAKGHARSEVAGNYHYLYISVLDTANQPTIAFRVTGERDRVIAELERLRSLMAEIIHDLETTEPYQNVIKDAA